MTEATATLLDKPLTFERARSIIRGLGLAMRRTEGREVRVWNRLSPDHVRAEATAYYTDDLEDAVDTARAMARNLLTLEVSPTRLTIAEAERIEAEARGDTFNAARWQATRDLGERALAAQAAAREVQS